MTRETQIVDPLDQEIIVSCEMNLMALETHPSGNRRVNVLFCEVSGTVTFKTDVRHRLCQEFFPVRLMGLVAKETHPDLYRPMTSFPSRFPQFVTFVTEMGQVRFEDLRHPR